MIGRGRKVFLPILFAGTILACSLPQPFEEARPTYLAKKAGGRIYADGNPSELDWSRTPSAGLFVFPWYEKGEKEQTDVRVVWDEDFLYVLFICQDANISASHFERNSSVSDDDCVEVFISPNPAHPLWYANFEVNCLGTWKVGFHKSGINRYVEPDRLLVGRSHQGTVNDEIDRDSFWVIEMAIPFDHLKAYDGLIPPRPGDVWGINFNRCGGAVNHQYSQWAASRTDKPNFHRPQDFGRLIFSGEAVAAHLALFRMTSNKFNGMSHTYQSCRPADYR